ncbi:MAG: DNA-processing protein DprA [Acidobacteriota bacterium]|nr:DNA-processing protein DprA [Acidobacteriota bacterium]
MNDRRAVALIGSRDVDRRTARDLFERHLSSLLQQGRTWYLGAGRGFDQWAMEWLLEQNEICFAVVPYTMADSPKGLRTWFDQLARVVELQLPRRKSAYSFRNRYMVDLCEIVIGFRSGKGGGTFSTLRYALRKQKEVHAIPVLREPGS